VLIGAGLFYTFGDKMILNVNLQKLAALLFAMVILVSACAPLPAAELSSEVVDSAQAAALDNAQDVNSAADNNTISTPSFTPRPQYQPGELVDYIAQAGDNLPALATRFNTTIAEILAANTFIPASATTMPPGMPMKLPIYYLPMWGTPYQILPDSLFVYGPAQVGFDTQAYVASMPGWLNGHSEFAAGATRNGAEVVDLIAQNYSVSPRLLLAFLEHQSGALTRPADTANIDYAVGYINRRYRGIYLQLSWAANTLNNAYYSWRRGNSLEFTHTNGRIERPDPWQNAGTVAIQYFFLQLQNQEEYNYSVSENGIAATYQSLFGDPWQSVEPHIPGSLVQPDMLLPFERGKAWTYTGGPHTAWGTGEPFAAIDFAPPAVVGGCQESKDWITAVAPGIVVRSEEAIVEIDLDGDGDPHTGWTFFYLHVGTEGRVPLGAILETGDLIGHPSCEGGRATGTHVHIARKYNGEWMLADGPNPFNLEGWVAYNGNVPYQGTLKRFSQIITACECSNVESQITAGKPATEDPE
jgi:LasA protease